MSKYSTNQTKFKDPETLITALIEMGFSSEDIELHETPVQLFDYTGKATHYTDEAGDKANIVIRKGPFNRVMGSGASNDFGFRLQANGTYSAFISQYDSSYLTPAYMGKLTAAYTRIQYQKLAAKQRLRYLGTVKKNGKSEMLFGKA